MAQKVFKCRDAQGMSAEFTLLTVNHDRWMPTGVPDNGILSTEEELREQGLNVPPGGFASVAQFQQELARKGYYNFGPVFKL